MEGILYGLIFIIGALFGSFFTLAVYRIPLGENILYKHSFCPNCKEKLRFKDLIPILSYIFLGGKCAYCGKKIRPRYLILEIFSGLVFTLFALSIKLSVFSLNNNQVIYLIFFLVYIASLFIIAGIDKENINIQKSVLLFGIIISMIYMIYVCIQKFDNIYTYIISFAVWILLFIYKIINNKKRHVTSYIIDCILLLMYMNIFTGSIISCITALLTIFCVIIKIEINRYKEKNYNKSINYSIPVGFYLCVSNILIIIVYNFLINYNIVKI